MDLIIFVSRTLQFARKSRALCVPITPYRRHWHTALNTKWCQYNNSWCALHRCSDHNNVTYDSIAWWDGVGGGVGGYVLLDKCKHDISCVAMFTPILTCGDCEPCDPFILVLNILKVLDCFKVMFFNNMNPSTLKFNFPHNGTACMRVGIGPY
jgi:hypothetical protein